MMYGSDLGKQPNTLVLRIILLLVGVLYIAYAEILQRFDFIIYDKISTLRQYPQDPDIAIVAIDEESLKVLGRWPWSRAVHAEIINRLKAIGNETVALDLLLTEAQQNDPYADPLLASAIAEHGNVILPVVPASTAGPESLSLIQPLAPFARHAVLGHADIELDSDGVARRVFLYAGVDEPTWPALGLLLADSAIAKSTVQPLKIDQAESGQRSHWIRSHEALIPYLNQSSGFQKISYARVLFDDEALAGLRNKTVIIGATAAGMGTRFATPLSAVSRQPMPGVEWHANVFSMLKNDRAIHSISQVAATVISVAWVVGIVLVMGLLKRHFTLIPLLFFLVLGLCLSGMIMALGHLWIPPAAALLGTLSLYPLWNWQRINQFLRVSWITKVRSSTALESINDGIITTDATDHVIYINKGAEKILRLSLDQLKGKPLREILQLRSKRSHASAAQAIKDILNPGLEKPGVMECLLKTGYGSERTVRITRNPIYDDRKLLVGSVIAMADITDTVELSQQVAHQESHDALTKLPNRSKLQTQFNRMIQALQNTDKVITVFFITLDNFKKINDAMGHHAGDKLLRMVSQRLFEVAHADDVIARWGGDEFVLLSDHLREESAVIAMAQNILDAIRHRFEIDDLGVFVSVSIGISFYPENGSTSEIALERAGTAMYRVKQDGGNQFGFYSPESSVVWTRDQLELETELRAAIKNNELQVLFQPIVNAKTHRITRMEALVRWPHPKRGYLSPSEFIPLAEETGQIEQLGEVVLKASCLSAYALLQLGYPVNISVNVNPRQLLNKNFQQTITQTLHDTGLPAKSLILEITESAIVNDMERVGKVLEAIKTLGVLVALDDFGTGYSSLTLLRELPIDILKIDKSFVRTLDQNKNDLKIVQAIIGLGKNLGLAIIAEGVETEQQSSLLLQYECDYQQGYYFSRPIPYEALCEWIQEKKYATH